MRLTHVVAMIHFRIIKRKHECIKNQYIQNEHDSFIEEKN